MHINFDDIISQSIDKYPNFTMTYKGTDLVFKRIERMSKASRKKYEAVRTEMIEAYQLISEYEYLAENGDSIEDAAERLVSLTERFEALGEIEERDYTTRMLEATLDGDAEGVRLFKEIVKDTRDDDTVLRVILEEYKKATGVALGDQGE